MRASTNTHTNTHRQTETDRDRQTDRHRDRDRETDTHNTDITRLLLLLLHLVEQYPAVDISLLWVGDSAWRQEQQQEQEEQEQQQEQQQQEQEQQAQQQRRTAPGWLLLRTLVLVATGAVCGLQCYRERSQWLAVLQYQVSKLLSADVRGGADE